MRVRDAAVVTDQRIEERALASVGFTDEHNERDRVLRRSVRVARKQRNASEREHARIVQRPRFNRDDIFSVSEVDARFNLRKQIRE